MGVRNRPVQGFFWGLIKPKSGIAELTCTKQTYSMKIPAKILFLGFLITISCNKSGSHEAHHQDEASGNPNQALYDQVMDVHDEVMPKSDQLYKLKKELKDRIIRLKSRDKYKDYCYKALYNIPFTPL